MRTHRPARRIKGADFPDRERLFQWCGDFRVGNADRRHRARIGIGREQIDRSVSLLSGRAALMNRRLRRRDFDGAREPRVRPRAAPNVECITMRILRCVNEHIDGQMMRPALQRLHRERRGIEHTGHHDTLDAGWRRPVHRRMTTRRLPVGETAILSRSHAVTLNAGQIAPSLRLHLGAFKNPCHIGEAEALLIERLAHLEQVARRLQRPGEATLDGIDREDFAMRLQINAQHLSGPDKPRFERTRRMHLRRVFRRGEEVRRHHTRRQHGGILFRRMNGQRLPQAAAGIARGDDDEPGAEVECAKTTPIRRDVPDHSAHQRFVPAEEMPLRRGQRRLKEVRSDLAGRGWS